MCLYKMRILHTFIYRYMRQWITHDFKCPVKWKTMYARGMEMNACALNVQIRGREMYLANPTLCRDSKFHHWNSSPQLNSTPPRSVPTRSVQHPDTLHISSCPASTSFRNAYGTRTSYFVVSIKLTARTVRPAISTNFCSLFLNCCPNNSKRLSSQW